MNGQPTDDIRTMLAALIDPAARAARLVLLLDERQPDELRTEALAMPAERLFWTLTQLDGGLSLDICQALVRAIRLSRGRTIAPGRRFDELWSAETAAWVAMGWLRRRWASLPAAADLLAWLADDGRVAAPPATERGLTEPALPVSSMPAGPGIVTAGAVPPPGACAWLDLPPLVGPPPGTDGSSIVARLLGRLRLAWRRC